MQSCSFQHLLAGQIETNAAKTSQHIFKSQPRTNPEGFKRAFKTKHSLSFNAACRGATQGALRPGWVLIGQEDTPWQMCAGSPRFCRWPIAPHTAPGWHARHWAGAALPKSAVSHGFCPRGPACRGPVRASDVTAGVSRAQPARQSGSPHGDGSFVSGPSVWGPPGQAGLCCQFCGVLGAESGSSSPQHPAPVSWVPPFLLLTLLHSLLRVKATAFCIHLRLSNLSDLLNSRG